MRFADYACLCVLAGLHACVWLAIAAFSDTRSDTAGGLILGSVAAQAGLLAVITAWMPWPLAVRLPLALAGLAGSWFALVAAFMRTEPGPQVGVISLVFGGMLAAEFAGLVGLFWFARALLGMRLTDQPAEPQATLAPDGTSSAPREAAEPPPAKPADAGSPPFGESQFRIQHLLFWMALVAVILAVGRWLLPGISFERGPSVIEIVTIFVIVTVGNALLAIPLTAAVLQPRLDAACLGGALLLFLWLPLVFAGQCGGVFFLMGMPGDPNGPLWVFGVLDAVHIALLGISLVLLRAQGFRLAND